MEEHLLGLKKRLERIHGAGYTPSAIYIDNCCHLRSSYQRVWPGVPVLAGRHHRAARPEAGLVAHAPDVDHRERRPAGRARAPAPPGTLLVAYNSKVTPFPPACGGRFFSPFPPPGPITR